MTIHIQKTRMSAIILTACTYGPIALAVAAGVLLVVSAVIYGGV